MGRYGVALGSSGVTKCPQGALWGHYGVIGGLQVSPVVSMGVLWGDLGVPDVPRGLCGSLWRCYGVALGSHVVPRGLYGDMGVVLGSLMSPHVTGSLCGVIMAPHPHHPIAALWGGPGGVPLCVQSCK